MARWLKTFEYGFGIRLGNRGIPAFFSLMALTLLLLAGCTAPARIQYSAQEAQEAYIEGFDDIRFNADSSSLPANSKNWLPADDHGDGSMDYLVLSGGGAGGSFSVGALKAWSQKGNRPKFDMVSGVSTGALIAPFAFLGQQYDDALVSFYTSGVATNLVDFDVFSFGVVGASVLDQKPLRAMVERNITTEFLGKIATEHRRGRRLLILTTNMDSQRAVVWNMGAIATSHQPGSLRLFQDVIIASASIPGIFPAVLIKAKSGTQTIEEMHSDGGTTSQLLTIPEGLMLSAEAVRMFKNKKTNMYILVNNALMPEFSETKNNTISVMSKASSLVIKGQTRSALLATYAFAKKAGMTFRVASIDVQIPYVPTDPFGLEYMKSAYLLGYTRMQNETIWKEKPEFPALIAGGAHKSTTLN